VDRLVLVGPTVDPAARAAVPQAFRLALCALYEPVSAWLLVLRDYWRCGPVRLAATLHHALHDPVVDKLPLVRVPALVVRGEHDRVAPRRWCEEVAARLPCGEFAEVPGASHIPNYSMPDALLRVALPFLLSSKRTTEEAFEDTAFETMAFT
jgi:pimeloyl-ACP methyl ester carboxylesterase